IRPTMLPPPCSARFPYTTLFRSPYGVWIAYSVRLIFRCYGSKHFSEIVECFVGNFCGMGESAFICTMLVEHSGESCPHLATILPVSGEKRCTSMYAIFVEHLHDVRTSHDRAFHHVQRTEGRQYVFYL